MIEMKSNLQAVISDITARLKVATNPDAMLRTIATSMLPVVKHRIHVEGKDATGGQIGNYTPEYMKVRTGKFGNATRTKKGEIKSAGIFTKKKVSTPFGKSKFAFANVEGEKKLRPNYNRTADTTVVSSLTRQQENDFSVIATTLGYGLGYLNPENFKKAGWVEGTYKKKIWALTSDEHTQVNAIAQDFVNKNIS